MKKMINVMLTAAIAVLLAAFTLGCSDDDDNPVNVPPGNMGDGAVVRVIHASPDAPAVDIYAEGVASPLVTNVAYGTTTAYLDVAPGTYNIQLRAAGSDPSSQPAYETGDLTIPKDVKITAVAVGLLAGSGDQAFRVIPYVEDFTAPGAGNAALRIIHGSADAPTVALDVGNDGVVDYPNLERFAETGADGLPLPADTELQIAIWAGNPLERVTVFTTPQLPEGMEFFVIATGLLSKLPREFDGFSLLAAGPGGSVGFIKQNPVLFALHASPDAPAVDIFAGTTELVDDLSFGELSGAVQVPSGSYDLDFRVHDNGAVAATKTTPALVAGERYLAVASGFVGGDTPVFDLLPYGESFALSETDARLRVIHASPDAPRVDVGTVAGNVLTPVPAFTDLGFRDASSGNGQSLPVTSLKVGVAVTQSTAPVATFSISTTIGLRAYAVAAGSLGGTGESFRLIVVDTSMFPWTAAQVQPD